MANERIEITITESGSKIVKRNLEDVGQTATKTSSSVDFLKRTLGGLAAAFTVRELARTVDEYTNFQNRLRSTGAAANQLNAIYGQLLQSANQTRQSLSGTIETYSRLAVSAKALGVSQQQVINFTRSLNEAVALSGASATEAENGLIQLSQGMAAGVLQGQDLKSVLEQLPAVADVIAQHMNVTRGQLRQLAATGKITSTEIIQAFKEASNSLDERFAKTVPTIGQSLTVLKNNFTTFLGQMNTSAGISRTLAEIILTLATHMEALAKAAVSVAAGFALMKGVPLIVGGVTDAVKALTVAIAANPIGFLVTVLTSAISALVLFRDQIKLGTDGITTLGDFLKALEQEVAPIFNKLLIAARSTFGPLITLVEGFLGNVDFSVAGVIRLVAKGVDTYVGLWKGAYNAVIVLFRQLPAALEDIFTQGLNAILSKLTSFINDAGALLSKVTEAAGLGKIGAVNLQLTNNEKGKATKLGHDLADAIFKGIHDTNGAEKFVNDTIKKAHQIALQRKAAEGHGTNANLNAGASNGPNASVVSEMEKKLQKLQDKYSAVHKAQDQFKKAQTQLNEIEKAGVITDEQKAKFLDLIKKRLEDQLDPLGAVNRDLDKQQNLLKMTNDQQQIQKQIEQTKQDLLGQGIVLNDKEIAQLREKLTLIQKETQLSQARNQVYQATVGRQQGFTNQVSAVQHLEQTKGPGGISKAQGNAYLVQQNQTLLQGTKEQQQALVEQHKQTYQQIDQLRQADLISEQTAAQLKARADAQQTQQRLSTAQSFFGHLASLSRSSNRTLAAIGKAAAVTQATIDGVVAVQKALASAPPPVNYALAAAVGVEAAANVAQIMSQTPGFAFGGDFTVGGVGGTDSQLVAFRATPGEKVSVRTPHQESTQNSGGSQQGKGNVKVINVVDPNLLGDYLDTPEGGDVLVNAIRKKRGTLKPLLSG